jgi:hypothetical protein
MRKILHLHSLTCTSSPNMNTWSNCRSEVKTNEMPSSNFCGCTSGFQKSAHVLNKPIGSCYLDTRAIGGGFITISVGWPDFSPRVGRQRALCPQPRNLGHRKRVSLWKALRPTRQQLFCWLLRPTR